MIDDRHALAAALRRHEAHAPGIGGLGRQASLLFLGFVRRFSACGKEHRMKVRSHGRLR
jgi:hypothetical protein